jgi:2-pyrone-4,6-dicarboxylate lactonase
VQSFQHGCSYEYMLHALSRAPARCRGVTMLASDVTEKELDILQHAGVVATRFAYRANPDLDTRMIARVHERGWQSHFMLHGEAELTAWRDKIVATPGRFVIEHGGWPPVEKGVDGTAFRVVLDCLDTGRCWVKLSPRFSAQPALPFSDVLPFIHELVRLAPDRLLWGSDWPHPNYYNPMPNDADLVDMMLDWVPDENIRRKIFVDNPASLFGTTLQ